MSKWVVCDVDASTGKPYLWKCDECGEEVETKWNYCPECGDPKTSKGKSINTLVKALETEHKKLREMQKAQPEIIYCKDCKRKRTDGYCTRFQVNINGIATSFFMPEEDDFCSRAERKTNE